MVISSPHHGAQGFFCDLSSPSSHSLEDDIKDLIGQYTDGQRVQGWLVGLPETYCTDHWWHWRAGVILDMGTQALMGVDGSEDVLPRSTKDP